MVCVLNRLLAKPIPNQNHHLVFANKTERDILWRKELDRLANAHEWYDNFYYNALQTHLL